MTLAEYKIQGLCLSIFLCTLTGVCVCVLWVCVYTWSSVNVCAFVLAQTNLACKNRWNWFLDCTLFFVCVVNSHAKDTERAATATLNRGYSWLSCFWIIYDQVSAQAQTCTRDRLKRLVGHTEIWEEDDEHKKRSTPVTTTPSLTTHWNPFIWPNRYSYKSQFFAHFRFN